MKTMGLALLALLALRCADEVSAVPPRVQEVASPAGANAAEPFLFATKDGVLLSWLEPAGENRFALRFAKHRGGKWSAPVTITERNDLFVNWADFPSIVEDEKGALYAHWLQKSGGDTYSYDVRMATSTDGGRTWGKSFL
ncbi:MAG: exo-alpha-sialidase, partial [Thermoanaerobaculia bacterium]